MNKNEEKYLGDGLYAIFDGYAVQLRAPRESGDHFVALEPEVLDAFLLYLKAIMPNRFPRDSDCDSAQTRAWNGRE